MTDEERKKLESDLLKKEPEELDALHAHLTQELAELEDANSAYPATREFLQARSLTNVRQLDADGGKALERHLLQTLAEALKSKS